MNAARTSASAIVGGSLCLLAVAWLAVPRHTGPSARRERLPEITVEPDGRAALLVTSIRSSGTARRGVRVGDRIEAIDGRPVATLGELGNALAEDGNRVLTLHLIRGDQPLEVRLDRVVNGEPDGP